MKKKCLVALAALAAAATLAGCGNSASGGDSSGGGGKQNLRVAFTPGFSTLAVHVADKEGIFAKNGLDVHLTQGLDLATYVAALDHQYDISMVVAGVFLPAAKQLGVVAVGGMQINVADPQNSVLMTDDDSIKQPLDLVGKTVGTPSLTGTSSQAIQYLVKQAGGDPKDVHLVQVGFTEQADQLKAGNVDAVISALPFWTGLKSAGYRVVFDAPYQAMKAATGAEASVSAFWAATRSYADKNPDTVKAFQRSIAEAIEWINDNESKARAMLVDWLGVDQATAQNAPMPAVSAEITPEQLQPTIVVAQSLGTIPKGLKAEDLIWTAP